MHRDRAAAEAFRQVVRPLLITIMSRLRPDLHPVAVGAAAERIVLECEALRDTDTFWTEIQAILHELEIS